jgi:uncharacterized protein involved in exopolysaccharide biosynthesis
LDTLILIFRKRRLILWLTGAATALSLIVVLLLPKEYTADALILPPSQNSSLSSVLLNQVGGSTALASMAGASLGIKNPSDMYVALFHSRAVEDAVIRRFDLQARYHAKHATDAYKAFEKHSTVALGVKDGLIRITVRDRDPNIAANIANGYVDEYRKLSATLAITEASQRRRFFEEEFKEANGSLTAAEEAMKRTQETTGILQIDSQARSLIESASRLRAQIAAKEVQLQAMRSYATENNPDLAMARDQLAALQAQLSKLSAGNASGTDMIVPKGKAPEAQMEYLRALRNLKYYEAITELIARQLEGAKLDEARQGAIIQVVDAAVPPDSKSSPHRLFIVAAVSFSAFVVGILWVLAFARWERVFWAPENEQKRQMLKDLFDSKSGPGANKRSPVLH